MRTSDYSYFSLPFDEFNQAQESVVPYFTEDVNLVVSFQTAAGKTAIAECIMAYHLATDPDCKVVYESPFRSLSSQKYEEWKNNEQFSKYGVLLCSSDTNHSLEDYSNARLIVITAESLALRTRVETHKDWLRKVSCVVFDESHLIGQERRGASLEVAMMRLTEINPSIRLILLSATLGNGLEVAKWIKSLNDKDTKYIRSNWRPCNLVYRYHVLSSPAAYAPELVTRIKQVIKKDGFGEKILIFVHSKRIGIKLVKELKKAGILSAFHNASLNAEKRELLENSFSNPYSGLDVLVSTSTLSAGVNIGG
jgi:replicative superfamily II helicase